MSDSTIDALATAIGQLGSGNLSALSGSNMQNLIVMGAAQSGLSYADLLTQGVSSQAAESLMQGIVKYISQMGNNSSNVVRSEYARIFGLNVSDILAASQVGDIGSLGLSNDISALLNATSGYVSTGNKINNALANFMYEWATGVASNDLNYGIYKALDLVSSVGQVLTSGITVSAKFLGSGVDLDLSKIIGAVPLISTLPSLLSTGLDSLSNALNGETGALSIFNKLNMRGEGQQIRAAGLLTGFTKTSGLETSGSMVIGNTNEADAANAAMTSSGDLVSRTMKGEEQVYDVDDLYRYIDENWQADITTGIKDELLVHSHNRFDDIYLYLTNDLSNILTEQLPTILASQPYGTYTRISEAANTVTIGNDLTTAFDLMLLSTMNIVNIYGLLANKFGATETFDPLKNTTYDWNASLGWLVDASNLDYKAAEEGATGG
ncbi:MAG: hypothetical protein IJH65_03310 [Methanobrevibacter sp.]|nr:hypothetical protein [Methanobrevibacter sp.]